MFARLASPFVFGSFVAGYPVDCNITDDVFGQMQIWVPNCQGTGCFANGIDQECAWHVHDLDKCRSLHGTVCDETDAARQAQHASGIPTASGKYDVEGYACGGTSTGIWYPTTGGPYPLVIYLHGSDGGDDGRSSQYASVAATGLVVVAPLTGGYPGSCSSEIEWEDAPTVWSASKKGGSSLSPGLSMVDWTKTGIWGYSMGAKATPEASIDSKTMDVGAVVCSHDARNSTVVGVPALYITGTNDDMSSPAKVMLEQFQEDSDNTKIFANLQGGEHTWPITRGTMNPWIAKFFLCELGGSATDCAAVYGSASDSGSLCAANDYAQCTVVQPSAVSV